MSHIFKNPSTAEKTNYKEIFIFSSQDDVSMSTQAEPTKELSDEDFAEE